MRVRPATPLSIILFAAFALLLLSVLSTPIIPAIHLASYGAVTFGVFGFCRGSGCSGIRVGYNMAELDPTNADFALPSNARNSLTNLLIVHPIAALFTLILLILSLVSHLHTPSQSPRYLLALLILCLPTFVLSLLAFLVDILIFLPHVSWAGWVVLAATVLIAIAGIVTCGMRRTLVSKVARRKRIADNAAMNGSEYYAQQTIAAPPPGAAVADKLPEFATFEVNKPMRGEPEGERIPLNPRSRTVSPPLPEDRVGGTGSFSSVSGFNGGSSLRRAPSDRSDGYGPPPRGAGPLSRPMPPGQVRNQYSNTTLQTATTGSSGPYGAPPQPRGYGAPGNGYSGDRYGGDGQGGYGRGPPPQNGPGMFNPGVGLAPQPRRGPGPNQFGQRGPPPGNGGYGGGGQYGMGAQGGMAPQGGPHGMMGPGQGGRRHMPQPPQDRESREYDYPEDQPIIDERREFEQTLPAAAGIGVASTSEEYRDDDRRIPVELATGDIRREPSPPRLSVVNETRQSGSYDNEYVPPRAAWNGQTSSTPPPQQSLTPPPAELPAATTPSSHSGTTAVPRPSNNYYEDVAPAFDNNHTPHPYPHSQAAHPPVLMPGGLGQFRPQQGQQGQRSVSIEELQDGQRSPAMSTTSNFTSISQRPPNPNWQPGPPPVMPGGMQGRRGPTPSQLLGGNPDFELPGVRGGRFRGGGGGGGMGMGR